MKLSSLKPRLGTQPSRLTTVSADSWRSDKQSSTARGYGYAWQKAREGHLRSHPLCVMCQGEGKVTAATVVDHKEPHRGDQTLFWSQANWQSLCATHHSSHKQREEARGSGHGTAEGRAA